jgi:hypothetical protein
MPQVQIQRVHRSRNGEVVVFAQDANLRDNHEYLDAVAPIERECDDAEFVRTVAAGSPLYVGTYYPDPEVEQ